MEKFSEARLSNTGLSNRRCVVSSGVDTLILNLVGTLPQYFLEGVVSLRDEALEQDSPVPLGLTFDSQPLFVLSHGRKGWQAVAHNEAVDIEFSTGGISKVQARIRLSSAYLHEHELVEGFDAAQAWAFATWGDDALLQVSEVHLYKDVAGVTPSEFHDGVWVKRSRHVKTVSNADYLETVMYGERSSPLHCSIYDKTREIRKSGKLAFADRWRQSGWDSQATVTRVEMRFSRALLREAKVGTIYELLDQLEALWLYATQEFMRQVDAASGASDDVRQRAPVTALWQVVQAPLESSSQSAVLMRVRKRERDSEKLVRQLSGCAISVAAIDRVPDLDALLSRMRSGLLQALSYKGLSFAGAVQARSVRYVAAA